jgi:hypothetical protein
MFSKFIDVQVAATAGNERYFARDLAPQVDQAKALESEELNTLKEVKLMHNLHRK